jgi:hypothetical protein
MRAARRCVLIVKQNDKARMTNAELMTNDKWRISGGLYSVILRVSSLGFHPKKLPPPTPDRREGRLFPPEQS